jgi:hypothetical protein
VKFAKSNEMAAKSNEVAATANERAEELKAENLKLGLQLEKERQARRLIERRLAPRFLSAEEQKIITEAIRPYSGHRISINGNGDSGSGTLCGPIYTIVRECEMASW